MAILTRQQLRDYWNTNINTNGAQAITGQSMNVGGIDVIDSMAMGTDVSPEYVEVVEITGDTLYPQLDWNGKFFRWTNPNNGQIVLPEQATLALPQGWRFVIYNDTDSYSLEVQTEGTDVIRSHNNIYFLPATSDAKIGLLDAGTTNRYYADIEQSQMNASGFMYNPGASIAQTVVANTWTPITFNNPTAINLLNVITGGTPGSLALDFPNHGTNGCYLDINIHASIELATTDETVDLAFGINGAIVANADALSQTVSNAGNNTVGMFWPFAMSYNGFVNNGDSLSLFIRSTDARTMNILKANFGLKASAYIGVDVTV